VIVTRTINGPARIVFEAFYQGRAAQALVGAQVDGNDPAVLRGGCSCRSKYRLVSTTVAPSLPTFFGTYVEVKPYSRLAWTNEEGGEGGSVTTVPSRKKGGKTLVVLRESYPSKEALDAAGTGAADAMVETFDQLDELLVALGEELGTVTEAWISRSVVR